MTEQLHPEREKLAAFGLGRLAAGESADIERHLERCPACQAAIDTVPDDPCVRLVRTAAPAERAARASTRTDYRDLRHFAKGGLGEVSLGRDGAFDREVAVKRLLPDGANDPGRRRRFLREAMVTGRLEHPGIVPVYGVGEDEAGQPCYAMRFVPGETLRDAIERLHATPPKAAAFRPLLGRFVSLCATVAYAHSRGVVHRDIKPANVAVGSFGETILLDWGLAQTADDTEEVPAEPGTISPYARFETTTGTVLGTPGYMAPDQAAGRRVGPSADIYSLGATLITLLTGRLPNEPGPENAAPRALLAVAHKAMAGNPDDRYTSAMALAADVDHWLGDEPLAGVRDPWPVRTGRWARRNQLLVVSSVAALLVAAVGGIAAAVVFSSKNEELRKAVDRAEENERSANTSADRARLASDLAATREAEAVANFATATAAVDKYTVAVTQDPRLKSQDLQKLRRELLTSAQGFFAELAARRGDSPELRKQILNAHHRLAVIAHETGDPVEAEQQRRLQLKLFAESPEGRTPARLLEESTSWHLLSTTLQSQGKAAEALAAARTSVDLRREAKALDPVRYLGVMGDIEHDLWVARLLVDKPGSGAEVEAITARALAALRKLHAEKPDDTVVFTLLQSTFINDGYYHARGGRLERAAAAWKEARAIFKAQKTLTNQQRVSYALTCYNLAGIQRAADRLPDAEPLLKEAIAVYEPLRKAQPEIAEYRAGHVQATVVLCSTYRDQGKIDEAEAVMKPLFEEQLKAFAAYPAMKSERHNLLLCRMELASISLNRPHLPTVRDHALEMEKLLRPIPDDDLSYSNVVTLWTGVVESTKSAGVKAFAWDAALALTAGRVKVTEKRLLLDSLHKIAKGGGFADPARAAKLGEEPFSTLLTKTEIEKLRQIKSP